MKHCCYNVFRYANVNVFDVKKASATLGMLAFIDIETTKYTISVMTLYKNKRPKDLIGHLRIRDITDFL